MTRRSFLGSMVATASGLLMPLEPVRVYSFMPGGWTPPDGTPLVEIYNHTDPRVDGLYAQDPEQWATLRKVHPLWTRVAPFRQIDYWNELPAYVSMLLQ